MYLDARLAVTVCVLACVDSVACAAASPCELTPEERQQRDAAFAEIEEAAEPRVIECYQQAVASRPALRGDLKIEVHFAKGGAFDRIEFLADELEDADLRACVVDVFDDYSLPPSTARCEVKRQKSYMFMGKR